MPYTQVMKKFKKGKLHSGHKKGPVVKDKAQALAIMLSEKRSGEGIGPSKKVTSKFIPGGQ